MYFPIGWPKVLNIPKCKQRQNEPNIFESIVCNRDRVLFAILSNHTLSIWFCKPCLPITLHTRDEQSIQDFGDNALVQWKPDSSMLVVSTTLGYLIFYKLEVDNSVKSGIYEQIDSPQTNLCRENVELFTKENIPSLTLSVMTQVAVPGSIPAMVGIRDELMVTSSSAQIWRYKWDGHLNRDYCLDLRRIPFCMDQQVSKAVPIVESNTYIVDIEYSPLVGGFSIVFNDGRAAFLTASSLKFDPNQTQGLWAPHLDDAQCSALNHKYRLIAFGQSNGQTSVYVIDEHTGGLHISHSLIVSDKVYTGELGSVSCMRYTPDGRALALAWSRGGFSLWSTFGSLLMCSLAWDYGLRSPDSSGNPLLVRSMEWGAEGYQLCMIRTQDSRCKGRASDAETVRQKQSDNKTESKTEMEDEIILYSFSHQSHLFLQGEDKLYINFGSGLSRLYQMSEDGPTSLSSGEVSPSISSSLIENKQWHVVSLPATYAATNWPIRLAAIDSEGKYLAVAGRCGIAHYSLLTRKWKLFGNETQEKDMVVFGGLLWYAHSWIIAGCYSIPTETDEIRFYPKDLRLCNDHMISIPVSGQVFLLENLRNRILTFTADCRIYIYNVEEMADNKLDVTHIQSIDVSGLCVHPACIVSITLTSMRPESRSQTGNKSGNRNQHGMSRGRDSFVMNVSGRLLLVHQFDESQVVAAPTVLASNVETIWVPSPSAAVKHPSRSRPHLTEALWLYCGVAGMRVWLPLFPRQSASSEGRGERSAGPGVYSAHQHSFISKRIMLPFHLNIYPLGKYYAHQHSFISKRIMLPFHLNIYPLGKYYSAHQHSFISKRIMLPFHLNIYPLGILYEEAILLGVENDAALYSSADPSSVFSLPFSLLKRTSQVYIHQILRQLIRRNLGYHAWEIARACTSLPYFPHSLELLLHEVLEEEATSKEPIPDAQLPSVIEFIQEFPVYLSTIVQCARKTEIALWGYLFGAAGKPKDLFQQCLLSNELDTAASYLIILQNLESSSVSRQYATLLLDATLDAGKWDLAKDLVRFLKAIDPNDIESPRTSVIHHNYKFGLPPTVSPLTPPLTTNEEDLSMLLGTMQVSRVRSYSTTVQPKLELHQMLTTAGAPPPPPPQTRHSLSDTKQHEVTRTRKRSSTSNKSDRESTGNTKNGGQGTAEDFYMDIILQRHARRLLVAHQLKHLGYFAATLDFHLVEWLAKERPRAARIDNFIAALKNLHTDFAWPYPHCTLGALTGATPSIQRKTSHTSLSSLRSRSPPAYPGEVLKFGPLGHKPLPGGGSIIGDSGYMSQDPVLQPHSGAMHRIERDERSILSEDTSVFYTEGGGGHQSPWTPWSCIEEEDSSLTQSPTPIRLEWSDIPCTQVLDQLSKQITSRGTSKAEVQLRYLLQIFMEAGCLDWTFIIAVLLRDAMAIHRISNAARSHEQSYEAVLRLRDGFVSLCQWSNSECLGYKPFMIAVQAQLTILNKLLTLKHNAPSPNSSSSTPLPRSRTCSTGATNADSSGCTEESLLVGSASSDGECEQTGGVPSSQEPGGVRSDVEAGNCVIS
ncbi:hypothetical protein M8J76_003642 [Diaphorina citri]|nr:hypothetical protein M8J76_003642 [Diaphorina citri]